jgi:hypothetical protein
MCIVTNAPILLVHRPSQEEAMNPKSSRAPAQAPLQFEQQDLWQQMPAVQRSVCIELLTQMLIEVTKVERSEEDERED